MKTLSIRIGVDLHHKIYLLSKEHKKTISNVVRELLAISLIKPSENSQETQLTQIAITSSETLELLKGLVSGLAEISQGEAP